MQIYTQVLDSVTKATNDVIVVHNHKVLLGKRNVYPQKDWWYGCGGRMNVGESTHDSTRRLLRRELAIAIPELSAAPGRVETVGHYSFAWRMREQPTQNHGWLVAALRLF